LKEAYVNVNSVVIKNGINFPIASADTSINPPTGIVIANFHTYKNYENLIRAIAAANVNSKFIFIGAGVQLAECKALASELRIKNKILFTGECNPHRFLRKAQYGIHVSLSEGMSNAIMEELAYGLPVLASNITANKALISDGVNGLLVNPEDIISIADGLKRICIDSNLRIELSKNTFKSIEAYSWQSVYREYEDTLSKLQPKI
jgi:glycosyltransferase involved in cell wall biosynthesis